jgi:hypothetical protein
MIDTPEVKPSARLLARYMAKEQPPLRGYLPKEVARHEELCSCDKVAYVVLMRYRRFAGMDPNTRYRYLEFRKRENFEGIEDSYILGHFLTMRRDQSNIFGMIQSRAQQVKQNILMMLEQKKSNLLADQQPSTAHSLLR